MLSAWLQPRAHLIKIGRPRLVIFHRHQRCCNLRLCKVVQRALSSWTFCTCSYSICDLCSLHGAHASARFVADGTSPLHQRCRITRPWKRKSSNDRQTLRRSTAVKTRSALRAQGHPRPPSCTALLALKVLSSQSHCSCASYSAV